MWAKTLSLVCRTGDSGGRTLEGAATLRDGDFANVLRWPHRTHPAHGTRAPDRTHRFVHSHRRRASRWRTRCGAELRRRCASRAECEKLRLETESESAAGPAAGGVPRGGQRGVLSGVRRAARRGPRVLRAQPSHLQRDHQRQLPQLARLHVGPVRTPCRTALNIL